MHSKFTPRPLLRRVMLAVGLALAAQAGAQAQTVTSMQALGSWSLDGGTVTNLSSTYSSTGGGADPVDVLDFPYALNSNAGLHSYGSTNGNFGSRSSGQGLYDVSGSFSIALSIENTSATAQNATFKFYITPGQVSNAFTALTGTQFVESGLAFDIRSNGSTVWGSNATLRSDSAGTAFTSGGTNLYSGGGRFYGIAGGEYTVDLGVIGAGQSITLDYSLNTWAKGDAPLSADTWIPDQTYVVPDQWVDFCGVASDCAYGSGYGELQPGETVFIAGHFESGIVGSSHASSGDPFSVNFDNGESAFNPLNLVSALPPGVSGMGVSFTAAVPEPSTYALMLLGLAGVAGLARRRRAAG